MDLTDYIVHPVTAILKHDVLAYRNRMIRLDGQRVRAGTMVTFTPRWGDCQYIKWHDEEGNQRSGFVFHRPR